MKGIWADKDSDKIKFAFEVDKAILSATVITRHDCVQTFLTYKWYHRRQQKASTFLHVENEHCCV